jgi:tetratricopeptide (TPR) repeat protein
VPGYALLLELTLLHFAAHKPTTRRAWKIAYTTGCLLASLVFALYLLPHYATEAAYAARNYSAWQRELTQLRVLSLYLGWILLPLPNLLHFYYDNYPASQDLLHPITTLFGGLLLLGLVAMAIAMRKRRPLLALGIGWFFVAQSLTSTPLPLELVFEHRNYPALFGILLALADLLWAATRRTDQRVVVLIAGVLLLNFGLLTFIRSSIWGDRLLLTQTLVDDNPSSARAAYDLARRYMFMAQNNPNSPLYSLSVKELRRATTLPSASPMAEEALLLINADHHDQQDVPALWNSFLNKLQNRPLGPEAYLALDKLTNERLQGKTDIDAQQLARAYEITIKRNPTRANLHASYAELAGTVLGDPNLAIQHWQQALRLDKDVAGYSKQLAGYLLDNHRPKEALAVIAQAWQLQPALRKDATLTAMQSQAEKDIAASNATTGPLQPTQAFTGSAR